MSFSAHQQTTAQSSRRSAFNPGTKKGHLFAGEVAQRLEHLPLFQRTKALFPAPAAYDCSSRILTCCIRMSKNKNFVFEKREDLQNREGSSKDRRLLRTNSFLGCYFHFRGSPTLTPPILLVSAHCSLMPSC